MTLFLIFWHMCPWLLLDIHVLGGLIISKSGNASFVISNLKGRCDDSFQSNVYVTTWQHYSRALCQDLPFWDVFEYQFFCLTIFCWCPNLAGLGPTLLKVQIFEKSAKNPTLIKINFISNDFSIKSNLWVISPPKSAISFKLFSNRSPKPKEIYPISKNCNLKKNGSRAIYL